jgi:hypothetical protein
LFPNFPWILWEFGGGNNGHSFSGILYLAMWPGGTPGPFSGIQPTRKSRTDVFLFYGTSTVTERD